MSQAARELLRFEHELDRAVTRLPAASAPVRSLLARVHLVLDRLFHGRRPELEGADAALGEELGVRLFGLLPILPQLGAEIHDSAAAALAAYEEIDPDGRQIDLLLAHCQLWEVLPEVHRGLLAVSGSRASGFALSHPDPDVARCEARDSLLMALAAPALRARPGADTQPASLREARLLAIFHEQAIDEDPLLGEEGLRLAAAVSREELVRFRGACLALAHVETAAADALCRRFQRSEAGEEALAEALDHVSLCLRRDRLESCLSEWGELSPEATRRLIAIFGLDLGAEAGWPEVRDGYLPPFLLRGEHVLTSPDLLRLGLLERNLVFAQRWRDPDRFHRLVSAHLEPRLLDCVEPWLSRLEGAEVRREVRWEEGEIDLLVHERASRTVLHVQAKAAIPPNGARMTAAVADRMREGLDQHRRLAELPAERRDAIFSAALGHPVDGASVVDVLLTRSCVGTAEIWQRCEQLGTAVLNPALLRLTVREAERRGAALSPAGLAGAAAGLLDSVVAEAAVSWDRRPLAVGDVEILLPVMDFDRAAVERWRLAASADLPTDSGSWPGR